MNTRVSWPQGTPDTGRTRGDNRDTTPGAAAIVSDDGTNPAGLARVITWILNPPDSAPRSTVLIRSMCGAVFLWEGVLKFVYTNQGVGRFTKLGFAMPALTADFVAVLEI